jgi:putative aldouronate transport system substrate-binding protein
MSRIKKLLSLVVVMCFVLSVVFTGCGTKTEEPKETAAAGTTAAAETTAQETQVELAPVELTWYNCGTVSADTQMVVDEANKTIKEKINATLKYEILDWGEYGDKIAVKLASAEVFDLCFTSSWLNPFSNGVAKGAYEPLNDLLDKYGTHIKEQVPAKFLDATKVDGQHYAIINYQFLGSQKGVWFDKSIVEKYNLGDIIANAKTLEDFEPALKVVKEHQTELGLQHIVAGRLDGPTKSEVSMTEDLYPTPFGVMFNDPDKKLQVGLELPQTMAFYKLMRDWNQKGYISKDAISVQDWSPIQKAGKVFCGDVGTVKPGVEVEAKQRFGHDVIVKPTRDVTIGYGSVIATMTAISKTSPNKERAMMLLDLLHADRQLFNIMAFGLEGQHYTKIDDNTIEAVKDSKYNPGNTWAIANTTNLYVQKGQDPKVWEITRQMNEAAIPTPLFGFTLNTEPIKNEMAQFDALGQEFGNALGYGVVDPEEGVAKWLDKLKKAGMDKAKTEIQRQIDEFKAKK